MNQIWYCSYKNSPNGYEFQGNIDIHNVFNYYEVENIFDDAYFFRIFRLKRNKYILTIPNIDENNNNSQKYINIILISSNREELLKIAILYLKNPIAFFLFCNNMITITPNIENGKSYVVNFSGFDNWFNEELSKVDLRVIEQGNLNIRKITNICNINPFFLFRHCVLVQVMKEKIQAKTIIDKIRLLFNRRTFFMDDLRNK